MTVAARALIVAFFLLVVAGMQLVSVGRANPYWYAGDVPAKPDTVPPKYHVVSPRNESVYSTHVLALTFNVSEPTGPAVANPYATEIYYRADWLTTFVSIFEYDSNPNYPFPQYGPYSGSLNITGIPEGNHSISVTAIYRGIYSPGSDPGAPLSYNGFSISGSSIVNFAIDTTPPNVAFLSIGNKTYNTRDLGLNFTVDEPAPFVTCNIDGQTRVLIKGNATLTDLADGEHNVTIFARDNAGNVGVSEIIYFSVEAPEPFQTTSTIATIASMAFISVGLVVCFRKCNHLLARARTEHE